MIKMYSWDHLDTCSAIPYIVNAYGKNLPNLLRQKLLIQVCTSNVKGSGNCPFVLEACYWSVCSL